MVLMKVAYVTSGHFRSGMAGLHLMVCLGSISFSHQKVSRPEYLLNLFSLVWCQFYDAAGCTGTASAWIDETTSVDNSWFSGTASFTCGSYVY
jgi:hypothetical protein